MCKGTVVGDGKEIELSEIHSSIRGLYSRNIYVDSCIYDEIKDLLQNGVATWGHSCCGHDKWRSQAFIYGMSIQDANKLGYDTYKFHNELWEPERYEILILLKSGTIDKPIALENYEVYPFKVLEGVK